MCIVQDIFHAVSEIKEVRLCWSIHVATEVNDKVLNTIAIFNIDIHEATNPVIEGSSMLVLNIFCSRPIRGVATKSIF